MLHLTNQFIDLQPVLSALARDLGLVGVVRTESVRSLNELVEAKEVCTWAVLARTPAGLGPIGSWEGVERLSVDPRPDGRYLWTDTSSNLLRVLKLRY